MKTTEGNKLIAEFMGYINVTPSDKDFNIYEKEGNKMMEAMSMQYHTSWDWLMPVVEKIETTKYDISNFQSSYDRRVGRTEAFGDVYAIYNGVDGWSGSVSIDLGRYINGVVKHSSSKIEATWQGVIEFIQWYNKEKA